MGGLRKNAVPVTPLQSMLREAVERRRPFGITEARCVHSGIRQLSREYAERYGMRERSAERAISRVLAGVDVVPLDLADRICTFLGEHLSVIYPEAYATA